MADSDEEFGRRRSRDKFVKERNDFQHDKRRDFGSMDRRNYGSMNRVGGDSYRNTGRQMSPPTKRIRRDWEEFADPPGTKKETSLEINASTTEPVAPVLMSFKQFLTTQDDSISDEDAMAKYKEYKLEFKRQQMHAFFIAHKEEEWFKVKYHPEESAKKKAEQFAAVQRRLEVFQELLSKNIVSRHNMDSENAKNLVKLMDAMVIKLEGGTDEDIAALDQIEGLMDDAYDQIEIKKSETRPKPDEPKEEVESANRIRKTTSKSAEEASDDGEASDKESIAADKSPPRSDIEPDEETEKPVDNGEPEEGENEPADDDEPSNEPKPVGNSENGEKQQSHGSTRPGGTKMLLHKTASIFLRNLSPAITKSDIEALCKRFPGFLRISLAEPLPDRRYFRRGWVTFKRDVNIKEICWNLSSIRLKDCDMGPIVNRDLTKKIRVANGVTSHKQVAQNDLRLAAKLVQIYDKRYNLWKDGEEEKFLDDSDPYSGIENSFTSRNPLLKNITDYLIEEASAEEEELLGLHSKSDENSEMKVSFERDEAVLKVLDRILLYLRLVHSVDYYNHGEYPCEDEMPNRCGLIHVRGPPVPPSQFGTDEMGGALVAVNFINHFCKSFEQHLQPLLMSKDRLTDDEADQLGRKEPEREIEAFIQANCQELAKDKWLCPLSGKKFKGPEFIRKHIQNKHGEKLDEVKNEVLYFNNYLYDPKRPMPQEAKPQFQQPTPHREYGNGSVSSTPYQRQQEDAPVSFDSRPMRETPMQPQQQQPDFRRGGGGYRGSSDYNRGGQDNYGRQGGGGGFRRDYQPRRDFGPGNRNQGGPGRHFQSDGGGRRDPRVPVTYTDLDAPDDVY